jgi:RHS repeat-associated protein
MYPNPPQHWGSAVYYDDNFQYPHPPWIPPGNGNTMADGWIVGAYNALNQPVAMGSSVYWGTSNRVYFGFDPLGRCVKRWISPSSDPATNPATYFYYDSESLREQGGWSLIQEGGSSTSAQRLYINGGRVDEIVKSINYGTGQSAFHHYDARGHCTLLTNTSAGILEQYDYDAFGWPYFYNAGGTLVTSSPYGNRFLFTGREWLSDLKLYDFRNRMYQPELGRFLQPDPKEFAAGDYNLYRYCHNDPVNKQDPLGLDPGDPFKSRKEAAADAIKFINPTSIKQNAEYGRLTYKGADGQHYATNPRTDGAGNKVNLRLGADKMGVPKDGKVDGDYHTHGDYSMAVKNNRTGGFTPVRATKSQDGYKSDHFSGTDTREAIRQFNQNPEFRRYLGTPSSQVLMYDPTTNREVPQ